MTTPANTLTVSVAVTFTAEGQIDWKATQEAFESTVTDTVEREQANENDIREYLHKYPNLYVSTTDVVSRLVTRRENANGQEYSPDERKVVQASVEATLESMKASGKVHAKPGKAGGIQTIGNHSRMVQEELDKKLAKESKKKLVE